MSFKTFLLEREQLNEKLIIIGNGKPYGQVVFMGGGGASGKDFAIKKFLETNKFKIIDIDELIELFVELERMKGGKFKNVDLKDPEAVTIVYNELKYTKRWKSKRLSLLLSNLKQGTLPNIIFNVTLAWPNTLADYIPKLQQLGYDLKNIHLVWVLANYKIALERNVSRSRRIDSEVLVAAHEGAATNMYDLLFKSKNFLLNGGIYVVLNNENNVVYWGDKKRGVIKDFKYLTIKKPGAPMETKQEVNDQLLSWIKDNIPQTQNTQEIFEGAIRATSKKFNRKLTTKIVTPDNWSKVKNYKLSVPGFSIDLVSDLDTYATAIFKKNGKAFLMQTMIPPTPIPKFIRDINNDENFIEYLKEICKDR